MLHIKNGKKYGIKGVKNKKKEIKGFIQLIGTLIHYNRSNIESVKYLLKLSCKNIANSKELRSHFQLHRLMNDIKENLLNIENNNDTELKINIKF